MRIPNGSTDRYIYFVAVDATDLKTRETGLSSFTVRRSRNGAASAAFTTPTINETDSSNMPGVYELLLDEDTTLDSGHDAEEMVLHITATGMAPVTRVVEIYRPEVTEGRTLAVASNGDVGGNVTGSVASVTGAVGSVTAGVTVTTNNDKTGYSLSQSFPSNFASMAISSAGNVTVGTNDDKTGYTLSQSFPSNFASMAISSAGNVTVGTNNDKTGYTLSQSFPSNFASMTISGAGKVTVGTNDDKTGYVLSQSFPTNFASMAISGAGKVTVGTNDDKTGYSIAGTITSLDTLSSGILAKLLGYFRLLFRKDEAVATDHATELTAINADAGSGTGAYDNVTDSVEAIRDRGDVAWITGSGGGNGTGATPEEIWSYGNRTLTGGVTVTTNNDKTGYSLSQSFPSNFASMTISGAGKVTVGTNDDKTGYSLSQSFPANFAAMAISSAGNMTVGTNNDKTGYTLSQSFPSNFASMAISSAGNVTVGTNNDKTGYSLSQSFPANFAAMAISSAGNVTVGTNDDKTGYSLSQSFPANFAAMAISGAGKVTVGTNDDKTGYVLSQSFPSNFSSLVISGAGKVTVGTNDDKTGYSLSQTFPTNFASLTISTGGNVTVGAIAADVITASALATDAVTEIANAANATLSAAHGNSSWETGSGANATSLANALGNLSVGNGSNWPEGSAAQLWSKLRTETANATVIVMPGDPISDDLCHLYGQIVLPSGQLASDITIKLLLNAPTAVKLDSGRPVAKREITTKTDADGYIISTAANGTIVQYQPIARTDKLSDAATTWKISSGDLKFALEEFTANATTLDVATLM